MQKAKYVLKQLGKQDKLILKKNEIYKMCRGKYFKEVAQIYPSLTILSEYGYIRELPILKQTGAGRPADLVYELNPLYFNENMP